MKCCNVEVVTKFCPHCGKANDNPTQKILEYLLQGFEKCCKEINSREVKLEKYVAADRHNSIRSTSKYIETYTKKREMYRQFMETVKALYADSCTLAELRNKDKPHA